MQIFVFTCVQQIPICVRCEQFFLCQCKNGHSLISDLELRRDLLTLWSQAYSAALQTQWQWIKELCICVEQHLKDNTAYFQVLSQAFQYNSIQNDIFNMGL